MKTLMTAFVATLMIFGAAESALAKGGDGGESRKALKEARAQARAAAEARGDAQPSMGFSFFGLFTTEDEKAENTEGQTRRQ
ncbi:MAG: hypothetical protein ACFBRM_14970 [Pikeienuella sp.]